jgi:NADH dehydrogenase
MSVAVIGASGLVGRTIIRALVRSDPSVKALVRRPASAEPLREAGAKVAVGELDDVGALEAVLGGSETVCHLVGGINEPDEHAYDRACRGSVEQMLRVAMRVGVGRILLLSAFGAAPEASNPFLRAKGRAEHLVEGSGLVHAIVRTAPIYGLGGFWFAATVALAELDPPAVIGETSNPIAPVAAEDVAAAFVALDDRRALATGPLTLSGPDRVTAGELARIISGRTDVRSLVPIQAHALLVRLLERPVSPAALEILAAPMLPDPRLPDAAELLGIERTPLREGLERVSRDAQPPRG